MHLSKFLQMFMQVGMAKKTVKKIRVLADFGFAEREPVEVKGQSVVQSDLLVALMSGYVPPITDFLAPPESRPPNWTKEIVTETDHTWGEIGSRYLSWVLSNKKMAMIFEFVIDFRYNLQSPLFDIAETGESAYVITMPPCDYEVHIRDIRFYDEQGSKLLPWLLPDLLNGFLSNGFSEDDKNKLVDAAKGHAEKQALELINNIQSEVQKSATSTLESISRAFGAENVEFKFTTKTATEVEVAVSEDLAASA